MTGNNKNYGKLNIPDWIWWVGIVESRADITKTGRYKVRIMGYHSGNTEVLPTKSLPFATVINSPTNASTSGIMETPNLLPGSTVIGFFADGEEGQMPVIIGSLAGLPQAKNDELRQESGFNDPSKKYPRGGFDEPAEEGFAGVGEPDLPRLARDDAAETHYSLITKRAERVTEVRTARAPSVSDQLDDKANKDYEGKKWDEPYARGKGPYKTFEMEEFTPKYWDAKADLQKGAEGNAGVPDEPGTYTSMYPFNQVKETEGGFVTETDNTGGNERHAFYHPIGNYEEIQADGTRVNRIKGSDYEIIEQDKNVVIRGSCNVTIVGDAKVLVQGDKYEEIEGDYFLTVLGDRITKINGSDIKSVVTDANETIAGNRTSRVALDDFLTVNGKQVQSIIKDKSETVAGSVKETFNGNHNTIVGGTRYNRVTEAKTVAVGGNLSMVTGEDGTFKSNGNMIVESKGTQLLKTEVQQTLEAVNTDILQDVDITGTSTASVDHDSAGISGKGHTHTDTAGTAAGTTTAPN